MIYIGTSGWNYAHWRDKFYPEKLKPSDFLKFYSKHFKTVEINYSFYRLPKVSTYQNWYDQTPKNFIFAVKASRFITHIKRLKNTKTALKTFLVNASFLKEKLGPILFQFPPSFQATEENRKRLEIFLKSILRTSDVPNIENNNFRTSDVQKLKFAFEFRHQSWCNEKIYKLLKKHNAAWVMADSPNYPQAEAVTADFIYIRMHGSQVLFGSKYTKKELNDLAQKILARGESAFGGKNPRQQQKKVKDIYIYFNNDFSGFAVENAKQLQRILDIKNKKAP